MNSFSNDNTQNTSLRRRIVDATDIVNVISTYVKLEKKGSNYIGLCPFHDDTNPSMSVSESKKVFKCFSCNVGGDVVTFVSKYKNISSRDAMRELGQSLGINVSLTKKEIERQKNKKYYDIMDEAAKFYSFYLRNTNNAKGALDYLHNRGLSDEIIAKFNIGASSDKDELFKLLESKSHLPVDMLEVGVIRNPFKNVYHDTFKNRIIFPIWDLDGNVCGFSGRRYLENDTDSKYVNTNETVIFKKGYILYNYHNALKAIKTEDKCYLFEGFMDVIASVRSGHENSIASMGTNLTTNQIEAIKRLTDNVVICFDSDEPGINATLRAIGMFNEYNMNISVVSIPDGKDPDEYIKKNGEASLFEYLKNNQMSAMDFIYKRYLRTTMLDDVNSKEIFKNNMFLTLASVKSKVVVDTFLNRLATDLNVGIDALKEDFSNFLVSNKNRRKETYKNDNYNSFDNNLVPPAEEDFYYNDQELNSLDDNDTGKTKRKKVQEIEKYKTAELILLVLSYRDKDTCLMIENDLNNARVDDDAHDLLYSMVLYYKKHAMIDDKDFILYLPDEQKEVFEKVLAMNKKKDKLLDFDLKHNELLVKEYPTLLIIQNEKDSDAPKTRENISDMINLKRSIVKVNRKKKTGGA